MNIANRVSVETYRPTVSGLFYCLGSKGVPLIGIHWPAKAARAQEPNLSPVAGEWKKGESGEEAIMRQVSHEYGEQAAIKVTPLEHQRFVSTVNLKQYHWFLVALSLPSSVTTYSKVPDIIPDQDEVASFGWYTAAQLDGAINLMHLEKQFMFIEVLRIANGFENDLLPFRRRFGYQ